MGRRDGRTAVRGHLAPPQGLEGGGQAVGAYGGGEGGDWRGVRREPVLLKPLRDEVGVVVVAGHGELGLQDHGVYVCEPVGVVGVGQQLAEVLLVQAGAEEVGVGVAGRGLGWTHGDVGGAGRGHDGGLPLRLLVVLPDQGGDVESPEWFLVWQFGWRGQFALFVLLLVLAVAGTLVRADWRTDGASPADDVI